MNARFGPLLLASAFLAFAACGGKVVMTTDAIGAGGAAPCLALASPGMCPPSPECVNGVEQTGQASCVNGQWVCETQPCGVGTGGGCEKGSVHAAQFGAACASDADCNAVYDGELCSNCRCPNAAIAASSQQAYDAFVNAASPPGQTCDCSFVPAPVCTGGQCGL